MADIKICTILSKNKMHHKLKLLGFVNVKAMFGCVDNIMYSMKYGYLFILRF